MMLLSQTLEVITSFFSHAGSWLAVWVAILIGVSAYIIRMASAPKTSRRWVVRKGECPFCGYVLFGITHDYQRLYSLGTVAPESQYLCTSCDKKKIVGMLSLLEDGR
jgi:hypothetical protein